MIHPPALFLVPASPAQLCLSRWCRSRSGSRPPRQQPRTLLRLLMPPRQVRTISALVSADVSVFRSARVRLCRNSCPLSACADLLAAAISCDAASATPSASTPSSAGLGLPGTLTRATSLTRIKASGGDRSVLSWSSLVDCFLHFFLSVRISRHTPLQLLH
jgi:hypothetical protein